MVSTLTDSESQVTMAEKAQPFDPRSGQGEPPTVTADLKPTELPLLKYRIWDYKIKLFVVASLLIIESSLLPIALFYGLWFGTTLRHGIRKCLILSLANYI